MILRNLFYLSIFALANCQTQAPPSELTSTQNQQKTSPPEMSVGLPPDKEAVEIAKKESKAAQQEIIYLKEGESKFLKDQELTVTFKTITEDSRCPKDVNCVWQGVATAQVELMGLYTRPRIITLNNLSDTSKGYLKSQVFNGYEISLVELSPQPTSEKTFKTLKGNYKIGLKIQKSTAKNYKGTTTK